MRTAGRIRAAWRLVLILRRWRRVMLGRLVRETIRFFFECLRLLLGIAADVDDVGRLESPDEGLYPRQDGRQQTGPAHDLYGLRFRVLARERDAPRQPGDPDVDEHARATGKSGRGEGRVVPEVEFEAEHGDSPYLGGSSH